MTDGYLLLKGLHIIFMVTWFAGLFYLPRLFVYHSMTGESAGIERFKLMERKLFWGITTPGGVLTCVFGVSMLIDHGWAIYGSMLWLHVKLTLVGLLIVYHVWCGKLLIDFRNDRNRHSHVWYRWFNEVPIILLAAIVLLAVFKPA